MKRLTVDTQIPFCDIAQCASYQGGPYCPDGKCDQRRVYETLTGGPCSSDQIVAATGLAVGTVLSALTQLEICGLIRVYPGRLFSRI